jgi:hypothetical protein
VLDVATRIKFFRNSTIVALAALSFSVPAANATFVQIPLPDSSYTGSTTLIPITGADGETALPSQLKVVRRIPPGPIPESPRSVMRWQEGHRECQKEARQRCFWVSPFSVCWRSAVCDSRETRRRDSPAPAFVRRFNDRRFAPPIRQRGFQAAVPCRIG